MKSICMNKDELVKIVTKNRNKHEENYKKAVKVYTEEVIEILSNKIEEFKSGKTNDLRIKISVPVPESHLEDYDLCLKMLNSEIDDKVILETQDYKNYVLDEWHWSNSYTSNTISYSSKYK